MRKSIALILAVMISAVVSLPVDVSEAGGTKPADQWTEPAVLCYYRGDNINLVNAIYVRSGEPIGSANIPELIGQVYYWVRMDTGEVVTPETVFAPGTYVIKPYANPPEPWGDDTPSSSSGQDDTLAITAIVLSVIAIITGVTAIYVVLRRK